MSKWAHPLFRCLVIWAIASVVGAMIALAGIVAIMGDDIYISNVPRFLALLPGISSSGESIPRDGKIVWYLEEFGNGAPLSLKEYSKWQKIISQTLQNDRGWKRAGLSFSYQGEDGNLVVFNILRGETELSYACETATDSSYACVILTRRKNKCEIYFDSTKSPQEYYLGDAINHEVGHCLLGPEHSSNWSDIMYKTVGNPQVPSLNEIADVQKHISR